MTALATKTLRTPWWSMPLWVTLELAALAAIYLACSFRGALTRRSAVATSTTARPVLLVHGYSMNDGSLWKLASRLGAAGVGPIRLVRYSWLDTPAAAIARIAEAAETLASETGVSAVDVVAHSLGGTLTHACRDGGHTSGRRCRAIARIVSLGAVHRRIVFDRLPIGPMRHALPIMPCCGRAGDLAITSDADWFVPPRCATLNAPAQTIVIDKVGHGGLLLDRRVARLAAEWLMGEGRAERVVPRSGQESCAHS